jgi:hypothetical protein
MLDSNEEGPEIHSVTTPPAAIAAVPQFATAEYAHLPSSQRCEACGNFLGAEYFRLQSRMICSNCAARIQSGHPADSHAAFTRALLLGIGAAIVGLVLYATVAVVTGWTIGYLGLAVGWLVGKAMMKGSNGIGGRRYQVTAVLLTYAAISMAAVPIAVSYAIKHQPVKASKPASQNPFPGDAPSTPPAPAPKPAVHVGQLLGQLALVGLASPFLEFKGNTGGAFIGLFILFIGLRIAWTLTQARILPLDGPYPST